MAIMSRTGQDSTYKGMVTYFQNCRNYQLAEQGGVDDLDLLRMAESGKQEAFNEILIKHRERLKRMVAVRMNDRLRGRLDASDVIQETYTEATRTLEEYLENPKLPVYIWLRRLAGQKLIQAHRKHLGAQKRDAKVEQRIHGGVPAATSQSLAIHLAANVTSPSQAAVKAESRDQLMDALETMNEIDREVLTLRHFEHLSSRETAEVLGLSYEAVKKRYLRALEKLHGILMNQE